MSESFNIYCDESCHLLNDGQSHMVLGAVWCAKKDIRSINRRLREITEKHLLPDRYELKWNHVSAARYSYYQEVLDYFFEEPSLHFRAVIIDKAKLNHEKYGNTHDTWYYIMFFTTLKMILSPKKEYRIYMDYKDRHCGYRSEQMRKVLSNNMYDFSRKIIKSVNVVHSKDVPIMQLGDLLIGLVSYHVRGLSKVQAKVDLVNRLKVRSGLTLQKNTLPLAEKVNLLFWESRG